MRNMYDIRFRAWDLEHKKMYDVEGINWWDGVIVYSYSDSWRGGYSLHEEQDSDKVILMQFIMERDKNGKMIYEGDIVHDNDEIYGERYGIVEWSDSMFYIKQIGNDNESKWYDYMGELFCWDEIEVIGNVYENSKLLNNILKMECDK